MCVCTRRTSSHMGLGVSWTRPPPSCSALAPCRRGGSPTGSFGRSAKTPVLPRPSEGLPVGPHGHSWSRASWLLLSELPPQTGLSSLARSFLTCLSATRLPSTFFACSPVWFTAGSFGVSAFSSLFTTGVLSSPLLFLVVLPVAVVEDRVVVVQLSLLLARIRLRIFLTLFRRDSACPGNRRHRQASHRPEVVNICPPCGPAYQLCPPPCFDRGVAEETCHMLVLASC